MIRQHLDAMREQAIQAAYQAMLSAETREERVRHWQRQRALILGRSPEQVRRMEIARFGRAFGAD